MFFICSWARRYSQILTGTEMTILAALSPYTMGTKKVL